MTLLIALACSDYDLVAHQDEATSPEQSEFDEREASEDDDVELCSYDENALFNADRAAVEQDAWTPGWNKVVEFTLTSDRDTCYAETFWFSFAGTDYQETGWNSCDDAQQRLRLSELVDVDENGIETWRDLDMSYWSTWSETERDQYIECRNGLELGAALPYFNWMRTPIYANQPITFALSMEAIGSTDPSDGMSVDLHSLEVIYNSHNANGLYVGPWLFFEE